MVFTFKRRRITLFCFWEQNDAPAYRGERGVVLALQNEFSDIFMSFFLKVFADISPNVELCQIQGVVGLKEPTF